ncbi:uncharacterized protein LAESUDRAFT_751156 [Laetiporus sulphureus 93-53]|uniref:Uncharacterized protein n=1 Tax=Laetiporus sulphureus 93-53 TaxID=1314785 RepID=A0A165DC66_9APHY|nr:uncharacterized protein LAESUDRAFT_751156 [Laetiporus sulphureus 93-53]KZT04536.1 hypothetical protein LAESUDRAFT_751156 [Laetiporus sulphureus 93-53]
MSGLSIGARKELDDATIDLLSTVASVFRSSDEGHTSEIQSVSDTLKDPVTSPTDPRVSFHKGIASIVFSSVPALANLTSENHHNLPQCIDPQATLITPDRHLGTQVTVLDDSQAAISTSNSTKTTSYTGSSQCVDRVLSGDPPLATAAPDLLPLPPATAFINRDLSCNAQLAVALEAHGPRSSQSLVIATEATIKSTLDAGRATSSQYSEREELWAKNNTTRAKQPSFSAQTRSAMAMPSLGNMLHASTSPAIARYDGQDQVPVVALSQTSTTSLPGRPPGVIEQVACGSPMLPSSFSSHQRSFLSKQVVRPRKIEDPDGTMSQEPGHASAMMPDEGTVTFTSSSDDNTNNSQINDSNHVLQPRWLEQQQRTWEEAEENMHDERARKREQESGRLSHHRVTSHPHANPFYKAINAVEWCCPGCERVLSSQFAVKRHLKARDRRCVKALCARYGVSEQDIPEARLAEISRPLERASYVPAGADNAPIVSNGSENEGELSFGRASSSFFSNQPTVPCAPGYDNTASPVTFGTKWGQEYLGETSC